MTVPAVFPDLPGGPLQRACSRDFPFPPPLPLEKPALQLSRGGFGFLQQPLKDLWLLLDITRP